MSRTFDSSSLGELEAAIDRLVANELGGDDRRDLMIQLDATTDGWRRCALAFLEDQAWRSALAVPCPAQSERVDMKRSRVPMQIKTFPIRHAIAAGLTLAVAGASYAVGFASARRPVEPTVAVAPKTTESKPEMSPGQPIGWLNLVDPAEGESLPRQVPILAANRANEQWLQDQPAAIPDYVRAQWERRGFQVEEHRRLVGLDLNDGRRVAVPIDEVALDYVGRQPL